MAGSVVNLIRSDTYSLGGFLTQGTDERAVCHVESMCHRIDGSQVQPYSVKTNFKFGNRSSVPSNIKLVSCWIASTANDAFQSAHVDRPIRFFFIWDCRHMEDDWQPDLLSRLVDWTVIAIPEQNLSGRQPDTNNPGVGPNRRISAAAATGSSVDTTIARRKRSSAPNQLSTI